MSVTVYGYIAAPFIIESSLEMYRHNRLMIRNIPVDDPKGLITRGMFNMPRYRHGKAASVPHYDTAPISFAANYKEMLRLPAEWIAGFEEILRKLYWYEAIAVSEFAGIRYAWSLEPGTVHDPENPGKFHLKCTVGKMEELPYDVAIEGDYSNR